MVKMATNWLKTGPDGSSVLQISLADRETNSKSYQMAMLKHCIGDEALRILKMLNFTKDVDANDVQFVMVKLDIYCSI